MNRIQIVNGKSVPMTEHFPIRLEAASGNIESIKRAALFLKNENIVAFDIFEIAHNELYRAEYTIDDKYTYLNINFFKNNVLKTKMSLHIEF